MASFLQYVATQKLKKLSLHPFDLTVQGNLTPDRLHHFISQNCGYSLFYGTERIDDEVMGVLFELAEEAQVHKKMSEMQSGEVVNVIQGYPSENRSVLHTAARDFFSDAQTYSSAKSATESAFEEMKKLKRFIEEIDRENQFTDIVLVGIGGSYLGPKSIYLALQKYLKQGRRAHFIANIDPDESALVMKQVNLDKTLVIVISKSGNTLETAVNEAYVRKCFEKKQLDPQKHMVSVTIPGSLLDDKQKYRECFYMWDWIGGRYSTTSMVGGVLLAFSFGFEIFWEFLKGANAMDKIALNSRKESNLPLLAALLGIWNRNFLKHQTLAIIPYCEFLHRFPAHVQQLDMESNGKHIDKQGKRVEYETGPIIWGESGTSSQHSFFQLLHQGTSVVPIEFIGFKESQMNEDSEYQQSTSQEKLLANLFAQILSLAMGEANANPNKEFLGNRPSHLILGKQLTPFSLGALLSFYEHKVAFQGFIWNINSFDQEGVQLGKVIANKIIGRFAKKEKPSAFPLAEAFIKHLES